jgi:hypothetical protein
MKILIRQTNGIRLLASRLAPGLALALALSFLPMSSAFAEHGNGQGRGNRHGNHGHQQWHGDRDGYAYRQPYSYAQPIYVPPPVYYAPLPSPGISLFFPLDFRHR